MISFPHAKVNIGLQVLHKREDGFHDIHSILYPIDLTDVLEITPGASFSLTIHGLDVDGSESDNLVTRAWELMNQKHGVEPVSTVLLKKIPMGAGLGGGSSDAAFMLRMLNDQFELGLGVEQLQGYAAELGSDCAFFITDTPMVATGRGEVLDRVDLDLSEYHAVLVHPGIHVSTADAYRLVHLGESTPITADNWKDAVNAFEGPIGQMHPEIGDIKSKLIDMGASYAAMSGSGSAVFGLFDKAPQIETSLFTGTVYQFKMA